MTDTLRKTFDARTKQESEREVLFTVTTNDPDSVGDRVLSVVTEHFRRLGGPVLFSHQHEVPPIGKAVEMWWTGSALKSVVRFAEHDLAETVRGLVQKGVLRAASIGFTADESAVSPNSFGGWDFDPAVLLEWSVVPIPANPAALIEEARAKGIDPEPLRKARESRIKRCVGPDCGVQGEDPAEELERLLASDRTAADAELVDELLELTSGEFAEAIAQSIRDEWQRRITPLDGSLGP